MIAVIHALWEFSPFIAGLMCGLLIPIRNRSQQRALVTKASLATGTVFAYAGGELASGGVWQSDDARQSWRSMWSDQDILNVGSLAIDPQNPATIQTS